MQLKTLATHTIDVGRLTPGGGIVLDAGCRDYDFALEMSALQQTVVALDADPAVVAADPHLEKFYVHHAALLHKLDGEMRFSPAGNGSRMGHFKEAEAIRVPITTIESLNRAYGDFAVVKLDIEGSEYEVLLNWPGPIADQITVEFHEHTKQGRDVHGADVYNRIIERLDPWYRLIQHEPTPFMGGMNFYDSLWVRR